MAIIDNIRGLEVAILVEGRPLHEHISQTDNDDGTKMVTRYVVAEPGKEFAVQVKRSRGFQYGAPSWDLKTKIVIDGKKADGLLLSVRKQKNKTYNTLVFDTADSMLANGQWEKHTFMFSDIVLDENAAPPISSREVKVAKALGEIRVLLHQGKIGARLPTNVARQNFADAGTFHERALKGRAISQLTSLGPAQAIPEPSHARFTARNAKPFAKFIFRYRSKRDLQAEMIIPRSPSPELPLSQRADEDLTPEQMLARLRDFRAANAVKNEGQMRIKREMMSQRNAGESSQGSNDVEMVDSPPRQQRVVETIDLTDD